MKKQGFLKVALTSISAIGFLSLLFVGAQIVMRSPKQEKEISHQLESAQLPPAEMMIPANFKMPNVKIHNRDGIVNGVALTGEEAVELAMMYLWGFFGNEFKAGSAEVLFELLGPWWEIYVRNGEETLYRLDVDANTGELLFFVNSDYQMQVENLHGLVGGPGPVTENDFFPREEMEEFYELAKLFASVCFHSTNVINVELVSDAGFLWDMDDVVVDQHFSFIVSDTMSRQIEVKISRELKTLIELRGWKHTESNF